MSKGVWLSALLPVAGGGGREWGSRPVGPAWSHLASLTPMRKTEMSHLPNRIGML